MSRWEGNNPSSFRDVVQNNEKSWLDSATLCGWESLNFGGLSGLFDS